MQRMEQDPEELKSAAAPRQSESDRPPVGEPLVVSRRNPAARPAGAEPVDPPAAGPAVGDAELPDELPDARQLDLDGRVALLTGATRELGTALAWELVDRGARVLLVDDDLAELLDLADALSLGRAVPVRCDLRSESDVSAACDFVGRSAIVDLVVHVADDLAGDVTADDEEPSDVTAEVDDRYRTRIRGPLTLVAGLSSALGPTLKVLLVERGGEHDALSAAAPAVLREQLPTVAGTQVATATCGVDLDAAVFARAVVDLLAGDDHELDALQLSGPRAAG